MSPAQWHCLPTCNQVNHMTATFDKTAQLKRNHTDAHEHSLLAHTAQPGKMQQHSVHHKCSTTRSIDAASKQCSHSPGLHSRAVLHPRPVCCPHPAAPQGCQSAADPRCHLLLLRLLLYLPLAAVQAVALQAVRGRVPQAVLLIWEHLSPVHNTQQVEHRD